MSVNGHRLIEWLTHGVLVFLVIFVFAIPGKTNAKQMETESRKGGAVTKLVFIHHSVGGYWLAHEYGGLSSELNRYGIYVNDITYGWVPPILGDSWVYKGKSWLMEKFGGTPTGADRIGDRTDIGHLYDWFLGSDSMMIMDAVYRENSETTVFGEHGNATSETPLTNPGEDVENEIVMIKPCYPNTLYRGRGYDPPTLGDNPPRNFMAGTEQHTVANCKRIYNDILAYFATRPDKFFVIVTAPPRRELPENGKVSRSFSNWLVYDWLKENNYRVNNVMVFDLYNVLTSGKNYKINDLGSDIGNHHRIYGVNEQHVVNNENNLLAYPGSSGDNHPSESGLEKATKELVPLLINKYKNWKNSVK